MTILASGAPIVLAALLQATRCHEHLKEPQKAAETYARLLKSYPHTIAAEEAARRRHPNDSQTVSDAAQP